MEIKGLNSWLDIFTKGYRVYGVGIWCWYMVAFPISIFKKNKNWKVGKTSHIPSKVFEASSK